MQILLIKQGKDTINEVFLEGMMVQYRLGDYLDKNKP
jgi:hypothetical protein